MRFAFYTFSVDIQTADNLKQKLGVSNIMALPKLEKIVVNTGIGRFSQEGEQIEKIVQDVAVITGQKPVKTLARKSIAGFKVRQGAPVGLKVTLRRGRMNDFLKRLIRITIPRLRDFRGLSLKSIDKKGNLTVGIGDHHVFPEIDLDKAAPSFGLEITLVTTADNKEEGEVLLRELGMPLQNEKLKGKN